ncbi:MAG: lipoate--protein ligase family protein [Candidatus Marinimicrobia bacterium]|jgi:lipoate-protein ligase A|nr:lipoate--protein ligase family protein [Candidatus Neomarinimicrobiota bacterium]MBT5363547.1 lipoate--protein ligase family protein [Candidatus Neomarinimicrobiota bacterium]MBT5759784.1 lipoate--protein ligase family protein [Candidatus Neomarinimicrobiota bacterium]MBT5994153.1 lipoate--protein ligase family protein [Candidatus Neomarinimicrobiota bacterium]MBT6633362.1 lipoate--protein ligase family protein [Candidatus Neomarinimicrobiota bacterium]
MKFIRLIHMGRIPGWQTQAVYHTVAELMTEETPDTIIISQPSNPYVCLGFHQKLSETFDKEVCDEKEIPILRRKVGGGGTYLDSSQLFYQCVFHKSRVPANSDKVYEQMLTPVVNTLKHFFDVKAELVGSHEVEMNGKRVAGIGGGQIGDASIVVGNILFDFDFDTMASVWNVPNESFRELAKNAMKDHIITLDDIGSMVKMDKLADQLIVEYESHLNCKLNPGGMTITEIERAGQVGAVLRSESFLNSMDDGNGSSKRKPLKIARNVFIHYDEIEMDGLNLMGSFRVEDGMIHSVKLDIGNSELEATLVGKAYKK